MTPDMIDLFGDMIEDIVYVPSTAELEAELTTIATEDEKEKASIAELEAELISIGKAGKAKVESETEEGEIKSDVSKLPRDRKRQSSQNHESLQKKRKMEYQPKEKVSHIPANNSHDTHHKKYKKKHQHQMEYVPHKLRKGEIPVYLVCCREYSDRGYRLENVVLHIVEGMS